MKTSIKICILLFLWAALFVCTVGAEEEKWERWKLLGVSKDAKKAYLYDSESITRISGKVKVWTWVIDDLETKVPLAELTDEEREVRTKHFDVIGYILGVPPPKLTKEEIEIVRKSQKIMKQLALSQQDKESELLIPDVLAGMRLTLTPEGRSRLMTEKEFVASASPTELQDYRKLQQIQQKKIERRRQRGDVITPEGQIRLMTEEEYVVAFSPSPTELEEHRRSLEAEAQSNQERKAAEAQRNQEREARRKRTVEKSLVLWEIDCEKRTGRVLEAVEYNLNGEVITDHERPSQLEGRSLPPDSFGETLYNKFCEKQ